MREIQVTASEIVNQMTEMFPLETQLCIQQIQIRKLEEVIADSTQDDPDAS